ncbi:sigma-54-dependent Fis family transcriptional regulator [Candidatus Kaiserbacteria bacterium]|nr:sigma-54-dependent Fis family transcriptional regulator [Candidatus Kaiserbacteria bacterium]
MSLVLNELKQAFATLQPAAALVGVSKEAAVMREFAERAAVSGHSVLLRGETGTGKDHLAELIHAHSGERRPFVLVDCGGLPEELAESELFGNVKGAFTGAVRDRLGLVRQAEGGTLFLNEIANMSLHMQAKFLRLLDKKSFRSVGGAQEIPVNTRIIAATNADLESLVHRREFREDLYYRLDVVTFTLPPLRERKADAVPLALHFLWQENASPKGFSDGALSLLSAHTWPGNVRELKNTVSRAVFMAGKEEQISAEHICFSGRDSSIDTTAFGESENSFPTFKEMEKKYIMALVDRVRGNVAAAARISGFCRKTVENKIRMYDSTGR